MRVEVWGDFLERITKDVSRPGGTSGVLNPVSVLSGLTPLKVLYPHHPFSEL